jgi:hypothetical protein
VVQDAAPRTRLTADENTNESSWGHRHDKT